ncbi:MAG: hypothetical protein ACAH82_17370 [Solirubrobacteraceae bacterium]
MHNRALHDTLASFVEEAAWQLADEVSGGAEVPFELIEQGRSSSPLYCYRPLTQRFLAERAGSLARLPSYVAAVQGMMGLPDLPGYLSARGRRPQGSDARSLADAALQAFIAAMWADATDFTYDDQRFAAAFAELEDAAYSGVALSVVVTPVEGLVIDADEVPLGEGIALVRGVTLQDVPPELRGDEFATVAVLALEQDAGLEQAGRRLRRLQTALRLWDEAEPALGPTAWARTDGSPWLAIPLATGLRRGTGDCLLAPDEEDQLRAFCSLVARRMPKAGELAWALRRFELGCERGSALEGLTDWLLCARALLAEPDAVGYEGLSERMAAICATPEERDELIAGLRRAIAMERAVVAGLVRPEPAVEELIASVGSCLRAILRDVLCGHLDPDLRRVADALLADAAPAPAS